MNERLATSTSPYLRAHADNPVDWHPWGEAAFAEARRRDVPVLVSIGYSTCHWCHVMARESFADVATAAALNADFVSIKVDREEHPEVDAAYMAAAAAFTRNLGWPLTVFATPEGRPFFAGTYFPPEPRTGMPSFTQVLEAVQDAWAKRRDQIDGTATAVVEALAEARTTVGARPEGGLPTLDQLTASAGILAAREDPEHGGFGDRAQPEAPKFPVATSLRFLQARPIREAGAPAEAQATEVAARALRAMAASPLHDRVEGGFFRYATRRDWTIPHYERMLTDNAQLLDVALDEGDDDTARAIVRFLTDVLQQPHGGFGAAQDSESWIDGARSEGGYYLRDDRSGLEPPAVDGKIVTGWNGLAIGALARAGARLGEPGWIDTAGRAAAAVLATNVDADGHLVRASLDGVASPARATLADYGQFAVGLIQLAIATGDPMHAATARDLVDSCIGDDGALAPPGGGDPVLRGQGVAAPDAATDGDEPSGLAALAEASALLWLLGADDRYRALAARIVETHAAAALPQPLAYGALLRVAAALAVAPRHVVVVAEDAADPLARAAQLLDADVTAVVTPAQVNAWTAAGFELFADKAQIEGRATAYDCRDFVCRLPVVDISALQAEPDADPPSDQRSSGGDVG